MPGHETNIREGGYQPVSDPEPFAPRLVPPGAINPITGNPGSGKGQQQPAGQPAGPPPEPANSN